MGVREKAQHTLIALFRAVRVVGLAVSRTHGQRGGQQQQKSPQTTPLKNGVLKSFDGKHPCPICKFVAKEKKSEQNHETQKLLTKLDFILARTRVTIYPPLPARRQFSPALFAESRNETPPTPPP